MAKGVEIRKLSGITGVISGQLECDVVVIQDGKPVAILSHGNPLQHALTLTAKELRSVVNMFPTIMEEQPRVRALFQALIAYKERRSTSTQVEFAASGASGE